MNLEKYEWDAIYAFTTRKSKRKNLDFENLHLQS